MLNKSAKFAKNTNRFQPSLLQLEQRLTPATFAEPVGLHLPALAFIPAQPCM